MACRDRLQDLRVSVSFDWDSLAKLERRKVRTLFNRRDADILDHVNCLSPSTRIYRIKKAMTL